MKLLKSIQWTVVLLVTTLFAGCLDITEEITLNGNGSGNYTVQTDMGKLLEMAAGMGQDLSKEPDYNERRDTLISLKQMADTSQAFSPEQKAILAKGTMRVQMYMKENLFKLGMNLPFTGIGEFNTMMNALQSAKANPFNANPSTQESAQDGAALQSLSSGTAGVFTYVLSNNKLEKILDRARYDSTMQTEQMAQMKSMSMMLSDAAISSVLKLPRPAKKVPEGAVLSVDKRTVTIKHTVTDLFDTPEKLAFTIEF